MKNEEVANLWRKFNEYSNKLATVLGRTKNIVGEYAEHLARQCYGGRLLDISGSSADMETGDGKRFQVKSRKISDGRVATPLNVIRSWDFDFLIVILFDEDGAVRQGLEVPVAVAKEYGVKNKHQNGWVITPTRKFRNDERSTDITERLAKFNS